MVDLRARRQLRSLVCGPDSREKQDGRYGVSTEIEGLVSRARELINDREEMLSPDVCYVLHKCADALSQTIPRTTDEGLDDGNSTLLLQARYVLKDLAAKNAGCGYEKMAEACEAAAMCRVSKTDEGMPSVIISTATEIAPQLDKALNNFLDPDVPGPVRVDLQQILWDNKVGILRVLQAVSGAKTDEGRNAVSQEQVNAAKNVIYDLADGAVPEPVVRAALEAANLCGRNAVIEWQPISTAPNDGTDIICAAQRGDGSMFTLVVKLEGPESKQGDRTKPRAIWGLGAIWYPTHWMPLPAPPPTDSREG
jgi:hypothetical protein